MKIAIIGTGNVGGALAGNWSKAGHEILLGVKDPQNFDNKHLLSNANTSVHTVTEAAQHAHVIVVATPPQIAEQLCSTFDNLDGKVIIDATNSINTKPENYPTAFHAFEDLTNAHVVKSFNSTGFENMTKPNY
ncbi:MAG: NAD(P)-binding domain-containing protein [Bacteroidota bacterium]